MILVYITISLFSCTENELNSVNVHIYIFIQSKYITRLENNKAAQLIEI